MNLGALKDVIFRLHFSDCEEVELGCPSFTAFMKNRKGTWEPENQFNWRYRPICHSLVLQHSPLSSPALECVFSKIQASDTRDTRMTDLPSIWPPVLLMFFEGLFRSDLRSACWTDVSSRCHIDALISFLRSQAGNDLSLSQLIIKVWIIKKTKNLYTVKMKQGEDFFFFSFFCHNLLKKKKEHLIK